MNDPLATISTRRTIQTEQATPEQVKNSAGGYSFGLSDEDRALRFLILGTDGGSYYTTEKNLTKQNAKVVIDLASKYQSGIDLVAMILEVSTKGRALRQDPTIFALAVCAGSPVQSVRKAALDALPAVCRTATHLFMFLKYVRQFRGWGRSLQRAVSDWYIYQDIDKLSYQMVKYRQREGYTHADALRLAKPHISTGDKKRQALVRWTLGKYEGQLPDETPELAKAFKVAQGTTHVQTWCDLVTVHRLPWEALPDEALNHPEVWEAMVPTMGITALIRNLARLTKLGLLPPLGSSDTSMKVIQRLTDAKALQKGRVHPLAVLVAMSTYQTGHGLRGNMEWTPSPKIMEALEQSFYLAFGQLEPANKTTLVALDVSGSMTMGEVAKTNLSPRVASAAMAMTVVRTEPDYCVTAFSGGMVPVDIRASMSLTDVLRSTDRMPFDRTDCAQPMLWATKNRIDSIDTFIIYTDNETWAGNIHPHQALEQYRQWTGKPARLVVVGMVSNGFTIASPTDQGMMDVVGFDTATPDAIRGFSAREF